VSVIDYRKIGEFQAYFAVTLSFDPYKVTRVLRNDRYLVQREGAHEGPYTTSTFSDNMKPWLPNLFDEFISDEELCIFEVEYLCRMAECRMFVA